MHSGDIDRNAKIIWDYMIMRQPLRVCDIIFVLCSSDDRVAAYAADLYLRGYGQKLLFSGGTAHQHDVLRPTWTESEAEHFAAIARKAGVPSDRILLEEQATNTGENITLARQVLQQHGLRPNSLLLVQKPYMERRAYATFKKQWPDKTTRIAITSPPFTYEAYVAGGRLPKASIIAIMVGDLQRIKEYPARGFQIAQDIPANAWQAYQNLVAAGFDQHLIKEVRPS